MRHFWLRCRHDDRKWTVSFHANDDYDAMAVGALKVMKLAFYNAPGLSEFEYRQAWDWAHGDIELINEVGVVIKEMEAKDGSRS